MEKLLPGLFNLKQLRAIPIKLQEKCPPQRLYQELKIHRLMFPHKASKKPPLQKKKNMHTSALVFSLQQTYEVIDLHKLI